MNNETPRFKTYQEIQRVEWLEKAYGRLGRMGPRGKLAHATSVAEYCVALIYLSAGDLLGSFNLLPVDRRSDWSGVRYLLWVEELLDIATEFARLASQFADKSPGRTVAGAAIAFHDHYRVTERRFLESWTIVGPALMEAIAEGGAGDPKAILVQCLKNIFHLDTMISARVGAAHDPASATEAMFEDPALSDLRQATLAPEAPADSFFLPFRLLHQLPELCALLSVELIELSKAELEAGRVREACAGLSIVNAFMQSMLSCNRPLRKLMLPAEYYKLRIQFDGTSGAHSRALSKNLLWHSYLSLAELVVHIRSKFAETDSNVILCEVRALQSLLIEWRALHLTFPRNLLGGFGAASLAGSPDGLQAARQMFGKFLDRDPLSEGSGWAGLNEEASPRPIAGEQLDNELLRITSEATKARYANVQERTAIKLKTREPR